MKNLMGSICALIVAAILLQGCSGHFQAAYGGGLWFIPLALLGAAGWTYGRYQFGWKSPVNDDAGVSPKGRSRVRWIALFWAGAALVAAIWMWIERAQVIK